MTIPVTGQVGYQSLGDGVQTQPFRQIRDGSMGVSEIMGRYYEMAYRGQLFRAHAIVTAPVIFTTAAGTGGPFLWNPPTSKVNAVLIAVSIGVTVVTTVAAALGITGNSGQTAAPTATTAIDSSGNCFFGGPLPTSSVFRVATPSTAGNFLLPFAALHTGALTVDTVDGGWFDMGGVLVTPPGAWMSVAASATATTTVASIGMLWAEVPV